MATRVRRTTPRERAISRYFEKEKAENDDRYIEPTREARNGIVFVLGRPDEELCDDVTLDATGVGLLWEPATDLLCDFLESNVDALLSLGGARAVELGSGAGVAGMVWAQMCGREDFCPTGIRWPLESDRNARVRLTDYHPTVLQRLERSVYLNGLENVCEVERLAWGDAAPRARAQLVFGSELAVSEAAAAALAATLDALLTPRGVFLYAHTARRAIFRGADGELCREDGDSALQTLVAALAPRRCVELGADDSGDERVVLLGFGSIAADLASMQRRG